MKKLDIDLYPGIKQYAQSLKKQLGIPLTQAQDLTAKVNCFTDWHDLVAVASKNPFDPRLRSAAVSSRSSGAINTPHSIKLAQQAGSKLNMLLGQPEPRGEQLDAVARGLTNGFPVPTLHLTGLSDSGESDGLNLFDPFPRFVSISGEMGCGKTILSVAIMRTHNESGGSTCYFDQTFRPIRESFPNDLADMSIKAMLKEGSCSFYNLSLNPLPEVLPAATVIGGFINEHDLGYQRHTHEEVAETILKISQHLAPMSILFVDEFRYPEDSDSQQKISAAIAQALDSGISVVCVSQRETLPLLNQRHLNTALAVKRVANPLGADTASSWSLASSTNEHFCFSLRHI